MKLLSWNIQWCRGVDGRADAQRIAREARAMADADMICLQEVARGFACDSVFVSADLAPRIAAFEVDQRSDTSGHQALLLTAFGAATHCRL